MRLVVVSVGRLRPPYADDVQHYRKLLARHQRIDEIEVREDEQVARRLPPRAFTSLLSPEGKSYDSIAFSEFLEQRRQSGLDLCFVVGGPAGLDIPSEHRLSLGPMTFPHQLARVVLLEQLLRAHKILANEPYHL